ncbi:N-acetylglucosaminyldiphosphodolichol N-acetylglucosaminyltransferase catalytic subunit alg13 [Knufia obscura]|uniref:UDP-N-acetylglucosamine transferase subunit ALG13 n=2 Tax=Knufia TaxID=430999 RepID=A0AAN8ED74_9EURO|nr:N-acetylglucosaminyldiphosphodolichol N-acetylglucosaminyltransferase catalytic subunit alg13 [Knufia obscura]KAK5952839.1 N-acetylglucosaminyldiphosphodolichol N-acetylglucosaminyltransferase catalytic subunit alg13 [Knufia fluminis]
MTAAQPTKRCFVTVGATASFTSLIRAVLEPTFLEALGKEGYTELRMQFGKGGKKTFDDYSWVLPDELKQRLGISITGFDFNKDGLREEMLAAKRTYGKSKYAGVEGCVISHAGSGSILDALRVELPIIVVPNPELLDNHQLELAEVLAEQNYVVHGELGKLAEALPAVEALRKKMKQWPPVVGTNEKTPRQALAHVMDDELGYD